MTTLVARSKDTQLERSVWWALLLGVLAARLGFVFVQREAFAKAGLQEILDVRSGGFAWSWAMLGLLPLLRLRQAKQFMPLLNAGFWSGLVVAALMLLKPAGQDRLELPATLELLRPNGQRIAWAELKKPVLVNVWATWCGPCRAEMPLLAEYAKRGARITFLNAGESAAVVQAYLKAESLELDVLLDPNGLRNHLQVVGLPTTVVLAADGRVLARQMGPLDRGSLQTMLTKLEAVARP